MLLMIVPVAWFLLHFFGVAPEVVFMVHIVIEMLTQCVRLLIVCPMIQLSKKYYLKHVILPICGVSLLAPIIPYFMYISMSQGGIVQFLSVCSTCVVSLLPIILLLGCTKTERQFVMSKASGFWNKIFKHNHHSSCIQ